MSRLFVNIPKPFAVSLLASLVVATALVGCGNKKKSGGGGGAVETVNEVQQTNGVEAPYTSVDGQGCLQGVLLNGFTGERIDLSKATAPDGAFVLIRGQKKMARWIKDDANLIGEYHICGIPVEETYPVYVYLAGYLPFESTVKITSTRAIRTDVAASGGNAVAQDAKIPDPIAMSDIMLFPVGNSTRPLNVSVIYQGKGVADAIVRIEPLKASNFFSFDGDFASNAKGTRMLPITATASAAGVANFPADKLVFGLRYKLTVIAPASKDLTTVKDIEFTYGINGPAAAEGVNNYELTVHLDDINNALRLDSCSLQDQSYASNGTLVLTFNREMTVIDPDAWIVTAASIVGTAAIATDVPGNGAGETMTATAAGRTLTLAPKWANNVPPKTPVVTSDPTNVANEDRNASVTYTGTSIKLNVVGKENSNNVALSSVANIAACNGGTLTVRLFKEMQ